MAAGLHSTQPWVVRGLPLFACDANGGAHTVAFPAGVDRASFRQSGSGPTAHEIAKRLPTSPHTRLTPTPQLAPIQSPIPHLHPLSQPASPPRSRCMNLHFALKNLTAASSLASAYLPSAARLVSTSASALAKMADLPPSVRNDPTHQPNAADLVYPRVNGERARPGWQRQEGRRVGVLTASFGFVVFGEPLQPVPTQGGPTTGFFRNNFADASPLDPGSHCGRHRRRSCRRLLSEWTS